MSIIIGIESSCDETGIAIFDSNNGILAHSLYSQNSHNLYGGVVPELASRSHIEKISLLIDECIKNAKIKYHDIDAIAYTAGPGLNGALLVGAGVANGLAFSLNKPVIPIHHLEGHLLSPLLNSEKPQLPFIALLVSGGNSQIIAVNEIGSYTLLGETLDDAAGEAFDKTARMLGLPYPGGRYIAELAKTGIDTYKFPRPMLHSGDLNLSFSGLKTAVLTQIKKFNQAEISAQEKANLAKSIEEAITDVLLAKVKLAIKQTKIKTVVISGGVSANLTLRHKFDQLNNVKTFYPPLDLCTDNGAMIALAGFYRLSSAKFDYSFSVMPRWPLTALTPIHA